MSPFALLRLHTVHRRVIQNGNTSTQQGPDPFDCQQETGRERQRVHRKIRSPCRLAGWLACSLTLLPMPLRIIQAAALASLHPDCYVPHTLSHPPLPRPIRLLSGPGCELGSLLPHLSHSHTPPSGAKLHSSPLSPPLAWAEAPLGRDDKTREQRSGQG
ncbi:hypothetical protein BGZ61DRAFT_450279 [Ilyonectria robusta]|uniref:uncharacterized protein n=1 Tax=Ilyonectria robusta TaxID=1079257 RepID=UPI001E8D3F68|nr:uncharacterized protein BGZ61DRAFT_450279 [Ilyonectria robusta]KAH8706662.1 hypothetical protein BGZ61DRAFT_450279 [Ilyonectria robusta]